MYCTIQNIQDIVPQSVLDKLTNEDTSIITKAIESAQSTVNAYLQGSYDIPELEGLPIIQDISEKITVYKLYTWFSGDETPRIISTNYNIAISELEKIQAGKLSLSYDSGASTLRQPEVLANKTAESKFFSEETWNGY